MLTVRQRLVVAVTTLVAAAPLVTGLTLWLVESRQIDAAISASYTQEFAEFRKFRPAAAPQPRLISFLESNLPDEGEILWAFPATGTPSFVGSDAGPLQRSTEFPTLVASLLESGGVDKLTVEQHTYRVAVLPIHDGDKRAALVVTIDEGAARESLRDLLTTYALLSAFWVVIISVGAWLLSGRLLSPLRGLRDAARTISAGSLESRIDVTGNDDLTDLQITFNEMLDRLDTAFTSQRTMLDDAAHELRTPLTVIKGHLEVVDLTDEEDLTSTLDIVLDEVDRMSRLVTDLLLLAKSRRPDFVVLEASNLNTLLDGVVRRATALADRRWRLDESPGEDVDVMLDGQRVTQALLQLCDNAVRFTGPDDEIGLGARIHHGKVELWVRDEGSGVAPEARASIFDRFSQGPDTVHSASGRDGFGLGLSIVSAIAAAHGGMASLDENDGSRPGSTFRLTFPAHVAGAVP